MPQVPQWHDASDIFILLLCFLFVFVLPSGVIKNDRQGIHAVATVTGGGG